MTVQPETIELGLNSEQEAAATGFFQFLFDPSKREMGITGPGGVGKTFLLGHMSDKIMPEYFNTCKLMGMEPEYETVFMTSTTNKAAEILSLDCNRPTGTIQSFLRLKVQEDFSTGRSNLVKRNDWTVHENVILFVDECSMIDTPLRRVIHEGTQNCKIVYVGDHCQLAPVMEKISPVFVDPDIDWYQLSQPMRTNVPELHALNQQLRQTVETGEFRPIRLHPGIIDWFTDEQMAFAIQQEFVQNQQDINARVLAYTNKRVIEYNDEIRFMRQLPDEFTVGEWLVNNSVVHLPKYLLSVEEEVEILSIKPKSNHLYIDTFDGEDVYIECLETDIRTKLGRTFTNVLLPRDRMHFAAMCKWLAGRKRWGQLYGLKDKALDLRQRDSSTFHKAQGSSLNTVYIDVGNLSTCHNPDQAARMLYVGASRARKHVVFYGQLAEKYGGFIL